MNQKPKQISQQIHILYLNNNNNKKTTNQPAMNKNKTRKGFLHLIETCDRNTISDFSSLTTGSDTCVATEHWQRHTQARKRIRKFNSKSRTFQIVQTEENDAIFFKKIKSENLTRIEKIWQYQTSNRQKIIQKFRNFQSSDSVSIFI